MLEAIAHFKRASHAEHGFRQTQKEVIHMDSLSFLRLPLIQELQLLQEISPGPSFVVNLVIVVKDIT
jgi:hypothetical protein